jgi:hypothetical protein
VSRALVLLLILVPALRADPRGFATLAAEGMAELRERWERGGPDERRRIEAVLDPLARARRFSDAGPVLVTLDGRVYALAELFSEVLDPALETPPEPQGGEDLGLTEVHRRALGALEALRARYAPPSPVRTGTLNLLLTWADAALNAPRLAPRARLRFFTEALRNVRELDGRVAPDRSTRYLIDHHLLPGLIAFARRWGSDPSVREALAEAAALLYLPSILGSRAERRLAPLTSGDQSRRVLLRAYGQGSLDALGISALSRSVAARTRDEEVFAVGAPPLILELLGDPRVPPVERGRLLDAVLERLATLDLLRETALDLFAAGFGGAPRTLEEYRRLRETDRGGVPRPSGRREFRFLAIVLRHAATGGVPSIDQVVRADRKEFERLYATRSRGGERAFLGLLVPSREEGSTDLLGPPPPAAGAFDNRLLRRTLHLERINVRAFGPQGEVTELSMALPEDGSEPVPERGARLTHVLSLIESRMRLGRGAGEEAAEERAALVGLLVRIDTEAARRIAVRNAQGPRALAALLPLAERGHRPAARLVLERLRVLGAERRERGLAAALRTGDPKMRAAVLDLCAGEDVGVAALAADALLARGDVAGVRSLLGHQSLYARACATSLALRLTPLAGALRIPAADDDVLREIGELCGKAFSDTDGEAWSRYAAWLRDAFAKPRAILTLRSRYRHIKLGRRRVSPSQFADFCLGVLADEQYRADWAGLAPFLLSPFRPGRGIPRLQLDKLLDAFETRLDDPVLRRAWRDSLLVLVCAQYGIEVDIEFLALARERLRNLAGENAPPEAERKAGVYWPIWAAEDAARRTPDRGEAD